jgi:hypothetical protein
MPLPIGHAQGKRTVRPERRPRTSRVTQRRGAKPWANTPAQRRAKRRAMRSPRPPGYMARSRWSDKKDPHVVLLWCFAPSGMSAVSAAARSC